jgi:hypothetical protein
MQMEEGGGGFLCYKTSIHLGNKHTNIVALSRNPIFILDEEDFQVEIPNQVIFNSKFVVKESMFKVHGWCI